MERERKWLRGPGNGSERVKRGILDIWEGSEDSLGQFKEIVGESSGAGSGSIFGGAGKASRDSL